jgi:hypothetical protein
MQANAGLFGPSDPHECMVKYQGKLKLPDAREVLSRACYLSYEDGYSRSERALGKCIISEVSNMYSYESALKVINKCSKDNVAIYSVLRRSLFRNLNEEQENARRRHRVDEIDRQSAQDGPVTIYDSATGTYKYCYRSGGVMTCN